MKRSVVPDQVRRALLEPGTLARFVGVCVGERVVARIPSARESADTARARRDPPLFSRARPSRSLQKVSERSARLFSGDVLSLRRRPRGVPSLSLSLSLSFDRARVAPSLDCPVFGRGVGVCERVTPQLCRRQTRKIELAPARDQQVDRSTLSEACGPAGWLRFVRELPLAVMERTVAVRSDALQLPFGDQALGLARERFEALGGLDDLARVPMLEDYILVQRLRITGAAGGDRIVNLEGPPALCDARRWITRPVWRVNLDNQKVMIRYNYFGDTPAQIFQLYYGRPAAPPAAAPK